MGFYNDQVLPRAIDFVLDNNELNAVRRRVAARLEGDVVEVGFGSGLNVPFYPPGLDRVRAVDPATVGRKLAAKRLKSSPVQVDFVGLDGQQLPAASESVDHILITWTMCTIPDIGQALGEMHRVLRPGGQLHFAEHGRSPESKVARWQDRLNPLQKRLAGGCNLNRPIDRLISEAGFSLDRLDNFYARGPKPLAYMYEGVATKG